MIINSVIFGFNSKVSSFRFNVDVGFGQVKVCSVIAVRIFVAIFRRLVIDALWQIIRSLIGCCAFSVLGVIRSM